MGKYRKSNRLLRRLILRETGLCVLNCNDPRILKYAEVVSSKSKNHTAKELARMYRHHCNTLHAALKHANQNNISLKLAALDMNVCSKQLHLFSQQQNMQVVKVVHPSKSDDADLPGTIGTLYFFRNKEISKPVYISEPVGDIVAVSESGLGGTKHVFSKAQVSHIEKMKMIDTPLWARQ